MGYTTEFSGMLNVDPPLSEREIEFLKKFSETRRMDRERGPYFVDGNGDFGQERDPDIRDFNRPPEGQPGLWCQWVPTEGGSGIEWDGSEKFYNSAQWMAYLISHFIGEKPAAKARHPEEFGFLSGHRVSGRIYAAGEETGDDWRLDVADGRVSATWAKQDPSADDEDDGDDDWEIGFSERIERMMVLEEGDWQATENVPAFGKGEEWLEGFVRAYYDKVEIEGAAPGRRGAKRKGTGSV